MAKKKEEKVKKNEITKTLLWELQKNWDNIGPLQEWAESKNVAYATLQNIIRDLRKKDKKLFPAKRNRKVLVESFYEEWKEDQERQ